MVRLESLLAAAEKDRHAIFVFWAGVESRWSEMEIMLRPDFTVLRTDEVSFDDPAPFTSMLFDIYTRALHVLYADHRHKYVEAIASKADALQRFPLRLRVLTCKRSGSGSAGEMATKVKARIRKALPSEFETPVRLNLHASDRPEELRYMASILLSPVNLAHVRLRTMALPRAPFIDMVDQVRRMCRKQRIDPRQICVVGGGSLEACGVRETRDLDIVVADPERKRFGSDGMRNLVRGVDLARKDSQIGPSGAPIRDGEIVRNPSLHFNMFGIKFASLSVVAETKRHKGRDKDLADLKLLSSVMPECIYEAGDGKKS